jgi:hypothetical protein
MSTLTARSAFNTAPRATGVRLSVNNRSNNNRHLHKGAGA